jgi:hypothetical protein
MLFFPGFNDRPEEEGAWREFLKETDIDMIQVRNLNIDPDLFLATMPKQKQKPIGATAFLEGIKLDFPKIAIASFSHYVEK